MKTFQITVEFEKGSYFTTLPQARNMWEALNQFREDWGNAEWYSRARAITVKEMK